MTVLIAKLNDKIVEIVKVAETVQFSNEKNWILISHQISKKDSLQVKWLQASKVKFDWVRSFRL
jgi:flagellar biosynthesis/type III secretory pathway chaperone